jgi:hypothetical protein
LEGLKTAGADALKNTLVDLDKRLTRLKESQDAVSIPFPLRKKG